PKGLITVEAGKTDEDTLMSVALDAGAEDIKSDDGAFEVVTPPGAFEAVKKALEESKIPTASAELTKIPQNTVKMDASHAATMLKLMDAVEDFEDTQKVYA
ncbi:MAG TPA: YebC/PmpR family DNA-binding transcriptional regulator, partial [candidate division Zixibacteria bacterium]|nr:YebC/PmpR family DNA-binding transcriptional regulator [candidate division Zixibacteria bacterium]